MSRDSARVLRELLVHKIDSLRYEFEHDRVSGAERRRLAEELSRTIVLLRGSLDDAARSHAEMGAAYGAVVAAELDREMPRVTVQALRSSTRGWIGLVFDATPHSDVVVNNERIIRFFGYPEIVSIEPSSPAERAGIQRGDVLLAFNGSDVRERQISLTRLLEPDRRVTVRVRRDGRPRDFRLTVAPAPEYMVSRVLSPGRAPVAAAAPGAPGAPTPSMAPTPGTRAPGEPPTAVAPSAPRTYVTPRPPPSVWVFTEGLGGARLETLNEGLARAVGAKSGVLVINAAPGTPAYESGLRAGDVIVRADGKSVLGVRELRRILLDEGAGDGVELELLREKRTRKIRVNW